MWLWVKHTSFKFIEMKKLATQSNGLLTFGHGISGNDFAWLQMGFIEVYNALMNGFCDGSTNVILYGCAMSFSGSVVTVAPGWIWTGGELYEFAGGNINGGLNTVRFILSQSAPLGNNEYSDGTFKAAHLQRSVVLAADPSTNDPLNVVKLRATSGSILGVLLKRINALPVSWGAVTLNVTGFTPNSTAPLQIGRDVFNNILMRGQIDATTTFGGFSISSTSGMRPARQYVFSLPHYGGGAPAVLIVNSSGICTLVGTLNGSRYSFDQVRWLTT